MGICPESVIIMKTMKQILSLALSVVLLLALLPSAVLETAADDGKSEMANAMPSDASPSPPFGG
jgi:hypothetical protein